MKILAPAVFDDTVDVTKRRCSANLSSPGWYRVMDFTNANAAYLQGATGAEIVFHITRRRTNAGEETHEVKMLCGVNDVLFVDEVSASLSGYQRIDKIRYTYDSNGAHVDIHVNNAAPAVCVDFEVYCEPDRQSMYEAAALASVADAPAGETVLATHDFAEIVPYFGTNANGKYYKYPDGTLICTKRVNFGNIQSSDWTAWGAWYESTNEYDAGDWPATFAEVPTLSATQVQSGTYQGVAVAELWTDRTTTKIGKTYFYRPSAASASSVTYDFIGIGRWK